MAAAHKLASINQWAAAGGYNCPRWLAQTAVTWLAG